MRIISPQVRPLPVSRSTLGEGVRFDPRTGTLWWVDILEGKLKSWSSKGEVSEVYETPLDPSAVFLTEDPNILVVAADHSLFEFNLCERFFSRKASLFPVDKRLRFNDGEVSPSGMLFLGTMDRDGREPLGTLYRWSEHKFSPYFGGVTISNGVDWSPDGQKMFYVESQSRCIYIFDVARPASAPGVLIKFDKEEGEPDGMVVDGRGLVWVCLWDGSSIIALDPRTGRRIYKLKLPAVRPTSLAIVPGTAIAYVSTAQLGLSGSLDGMVLEVQLPTAVRGASPRFLPKDSFVSRA